MRRDRTGVRTYSPEELKDMLVKMRAASDAFYRSAAAIGHHSYIEFTGILNEYIKVCETAVANGQDFTLANTHTGGALPMLPHHVLYLAEKLNCIFGPSLVADPVLGRAFVAAVLNGEEMAPLEGCGPAESESMADRLPHLDLDAAKREIIRLSDLAELLITKGAVARQLLNRVAVVLQDDDVETTLFAEINDYLERTSWRAT